MLKVIESEYWDPKIETMPLKELKEIQLKKIKELLIYAYNNSSFYRRRFDEAGVKPEDIKTLDDFRRKIPFFRKDDLRVEAERTGDPFAGMLTVPFEELETIHSSTGTTGIPTFTAMTESEAEELAEAMIRYAWMMKHRPGTRHMGIAAVGVSPFWHWWSTIWGKAFGKIMGAEFPGSSYFGNVVGVPFFSESYTKFPASHIFFIADYLPYIIEECAKRGVEPKDAMKVGYLFQAGEAITPYQRKRYIEKFNLKDFYDISGVSEPFVSSVECYMHNGGHVWADYWYVELIDSKTGEPLEPDEPGKSRGEYVVTNLFMRSIPWIRYATEDFAWWSEDKCGCGRTHPRIRVLDRVMYVIKVKDKSIIPYDVRTVFEKHPETEEAAFNIIKYAEQMDVLRLRASYNPTLTKDPEELKSRIIKSFKDMLGVDAEIEWVPYEKLEKILHKLVRIVDLTKK